MKKRIALIMAIVVAVTSILCFSVHALAATSGTSGSLKWSLDTKTGVFTVTGAGYGDNYTRVTDQPWYLNRSSIKTVVVEDGVQALGDNWFNSCSKISSIKLPESLVKLGANCFRSCTSLTGATVPIGCTEIYAGVFNNCTALKWVVMPSDSNADIYKHLVPDSCFYGCINLEQVYLGEGFTGLYANAFFNCTSLTTIVCQGNTFDAIGDSALNNVPASLTLVGKSDIKGFCDNYGYTYLAPNGTCGSKLNYTYDLDTRALTITGTSSMSSNPWSKYSYLISDIDISDISSPFSLSICQKAFQNCTNAGNEINISSYFNKINAYAFYNSSFHFVTISGKSVSIGTKAFDNTKEIAFYGQHNSGVYDYVKSERTSDQLWKYYCLDSDHEFPEEPDKNGIIKCNYCDKMYGKTNVSTLGDHDYVYQAKSGNNLLYICNHCGTADHPESIDNVLADFECTMSTDQGRANYDGRFDILEDGYINAKDYAILKDMRKGITTGYEMTLTNKNATDSAKRLYSYICSVNKNGLLTGQQESTWMGSEDYEFDYIKNATGKYPAIRGLDFMNDDFSGVVSRSKKWAEKGGIVTICWHCSSAFDKSYDQCKADALTPAQWEAMLTPGTAEYKKTIKAMDKAGNALLQLQEAGIPVLWRPFHEFDGNWFWWGKGGSEYFKRLWIMMYDHYTKDLGLNNLIWVLGFSHNGTEAGTVFENWYPGNQYCDIVGADTYEVAENGAEARLYNPVKKVCGDTKPLAMHESGLNPTIEQFKSTPWCYFMTWHTTYLTVENTNQSLYNLYNNDYSITLDELPSLYK